MKELSYKNYTIQTIKSSSYIYNKGGELMGCTISDVNYDENDKPIYNSEDKARQRIDKGVVNLLNIVK